MKLDRDSFNTLFDAISDGFTDYDDLGLLSRFCHRELADITERTKRPVVIQRLIEDVAERDSLEQFIDCMQRRYPENLMVAALDFAALNAAPSDAEVVEESGGGATFKDKLKATLGQLEVPGLQLVVADELRGLLGGASDQEARTVYLATLGNLKVERPEDVVRALVPVLGASLSRLIGPAKRPDGLELDLDRTRLRRIDLSGLDLHEGDIAFADLRHADLDDANLWRSLGYAVDVSNAGLTGANLEEARWHSAVAQGTRFHNCRMISAFMKEADLTGAEFYQSRLQGAHLERSDLTGARFEGANVADAYFSGATIDDAAATSLARAAGWQKAFFDPDARQRIERLA